MGVKVTIGAYEFQVSNYSLTEDTTPLAAGDSEGSVGSFTFSVPAPDPNAPLRPGYDKLNAFGGDYFGGQSVVISDTRYGSLPGTIRSTGRDQDGSWTFSGVSRLDLLNIYNIQAQPYVGTLQGAFTYYLSLAGVTSGFAVSPDVANYPVRALGFSGELWYRLKQMAVAFDSEIALVNGVIMLRPVRTRVALQGKDIDRSSSRELGTLAQSVEVYNYNTRQITNELVYPPGGWTPEVEVLNVNAGEEAEYTLELSASISTLVQPTMQTFVGSHEASQSVYTIVADDGLVVQPSMWSAHGGRVSFEIGEDTTSILVRLRGATRIPLANGETARNFSLALASDATGNRYSTLRILASGVSFDKEARRIRTGLTPQQTATEVGVTIDNPFIFSNDQLYSAGTRAARQYAGNPGGASGSIVAISRTEGEVIGNVGGIRVYDRKTARHYRVRRATITPESIQFDGDEDLTHEDVQQARFGKTYGDVQAERAGMTYFQDQVVGVR